MTVVISQTISHGRREGYKVAVSPLLTDIPIILLCLFALSKLDDYQSSLGIVSILGGLFIIYLAIESFKAKEIRVGSKQFKPYSIRKGIIVNVLSPHPYLFWLTVGVPVLFKSYQISLGATLAFILSFYVFLVGSKLLIAALVDKSRSFLKNKSYAWIMRGLGFLLFVFAGIFIKEGLEYLGVL